MVFGVFDDSFNVAAAHKLGDHVGLALFFSQVEDGDDVGMGAQPAHGLRFTLVFASIVCIIILTF